MRNLDKYPITIDEAIQAVEKSILDHENSEKGKSQDEISIGSIHRWSLMTAVDIIKASKIQDDYSKVGNEYVLEVIQSMEDSIPGLIPMFYVTGSYERDMEESLNMRKQFNIPRPKIIQDNIDSIKNEYDAWGRWHDRRLKIHKNALKNNWSYWIGNKIGLPSCQFS